MSAAFGPLVAMLVLGLLSSVHCGAMCGGIVMALPDSLTLGPRWLVLVLVGGLLVPTVISHRRGHHTLNHVLGLGVNAG